MTDLPRKERRVSEKTTDKKSKLVESFIVPTCAFNNNSQEGGNMLVPKRPRSVYDHRPVAVQVVKQEKSGAVDKHVLIVERPQNKPAPPKAK